MKVGLIVVLGGDLVRSTEHLGVAYIAAYLRCYNHEVEIIEVMIKDDTLQLDNVLEKQFDLVGFTTTCVNMKGILELAKLVKEKYNNTHITLGGHMATFWGKQILEENLFVDSVIRGEGEITFYELTEALKQKKEIKGIAGITYREGQLVIENEDRALIEDLDMLPFPVRDQFDLHNNRFQYLRVCSSRGCLGKCGFCSSFVGRGQRDFRWRGRSPKNVVDEIEELVKKYDFHTYDFIDSTFEDPGIEGKKRIKKIAEELIVRKLDIYYNCCFRAENWNDNDMELLKILVESGLEKVNIGFESGNDRGLKILNKRARMQHNNKVIKLLGNFPEIYITFGFIMFHPYSILQDIEDNAKFLFNTGIGQVIRHYFWKLEIYPSTLMELKMQKDGMIKKNYAICDGMYEYEFIETAVEKISSISQEFLKIEEVWDFEIFDILIHTFIMRMKRKYNKEINVTNKIIEFENVVIKARKEMATFNYYFFMNIVENHNNYDLDKDKEILKTYIAKKMDYIKDKQLKMGIGLIKEGYQLIDNY